MAFTGRRRTPQEKRNAEKQAIYGLHKAFHKKKVADCEYCNGNPLGMLR